MRKLYTLMGVTLIAGSVSAQAYFGKDFEDQDINSGGCTTQLITGSLDWFSGSFSGNSFAKMSNFSGGANSASETWYITPGIDLSSATSPIFSFVTAANFTGADLEVYTSVDYDGTSNPNTQGTWTAITAPLSTGTNYDWVNSGEISVTNTSTMTYFAFKYTGTASDGKTWEIDSIFVAEAGTPFESTIVVAPPSTVSVYDIQNSTGASPYDGQSVFTGGIVSHVRGDGRFYIQSGNGPFSGVYVYDNAQTVAIGDSVTFTAEVDEYFDLTELKNVTGFTLVSSGNFLLSTPISTNDIASEAYESVFVNICGVCITEEGQYQDWTINDGSGIGNVDNYANGFHASGTNVTPPVLGNSYQVKGIIDYSFSEFKLLPRTAVDVQQTAQCVVSVEENTVEFSVYPNPADALINIDVEGTHRLVVTDLSGKVMSNQMINGFTTLDFSDYTAGVYFFNIEGNVSKVIVK